jgi:four helix bundle protein
MNRRIYQFEQLEVWQNAKALNKKLYQLTNSFPKNLDLAFRSQIQRASVSICANIAEGSGRRKGKDQGQFYKIAYSSAIEILNHLLLCINNEIITEDYFLKELCPLVEKITRQLNALYKSAISSENGIPK